ncbi:MAG: glutamate--tRNA ligase [Clostridia bacterium]|nr:glutamate--tRNA ligase [Clostridia bacterium]
MTEKEYSELADLLYPNTLDTSFYFNKYKPRDVQGEVTRIAPSPTGYLHIGQLYQALVHRMLADKTNGLFYCRLEDTDGKREVENAGKIAYDMLCRFGLKPDEGYCGDNNEVGDYGPYKQSERVEIYRAFAHDLVKRGKAFPCFCEVTSGKEEILKRREEELETNDDLEVKDPCRELSLEDVKQKLEQGKTFALRLKSDGDKEKSYKFIDAIKGEKEVRENTKDDVLIKSNGIPVYAFAHIVDDMLMKTTTVIRGQEWYQSLPVHLELSKAFGYKPFKYAHTPNICVLDENGNKRKISKRKDTFADVRFFLKTGYPITAVIEYLLNLLNSDFENWRKNNPELSYKEFPFAVKKIGVTNPLFDFVKLNDISKTIISKYTAEQVYESLINWAKEWSTNDVAKIEQNKDVLIKIFSIDRGTPRPRKDITYMSEVLELYNYVLPNFEPTFNFELGAVDKNDLIVFLNDYKDNYQQAVDNQAWFEDLKSMSIKHNFVDNKTYKQNPEAYSGNVSDTSKFIRLAITGKENSPELYSIMKILGVKKCKARLQNLIEYIQKI